MSLNFENFAAKGNEFINTLDRELGDKGRDHAARVLRCVLRALRCRLSVEESLHLLSQLPMVIKAVYVDGWKPTRQRKRIKNMEDFADEVIREDGLTAWRDFANREEAIVAVKAVMRTLSTYVSAGEMADVSTIFPSSMKEEINDWIESGY